MSLRPWASITWCGNIELKKTRGEMEVQKLLWCRSSCRRYPRMTIPWRRAAAHHSVCSTGISWLCISTCQWPQQSPWGDQLFSFHLFFFEDIQEWSHFYTPNYNRHGWAVGRNIHACGRDLSPSPLPIHRREIAIVSQEKRCTGCT